MGCLKTNKKSTDLDKVINSNNLCILEVHNDPCGSDHFSIILKITQLIHNNIPPAGKQIRPTGNNLKLYAVEDCFKNQTA